MSDKNSIESEFNKLNISDLVTINHENCYQPPIKVWCKECVPSCIIKGWTSGNSEIDNFIKDTIYNAKGYHPLFLEWVSFDRFEDIKQIGEGGFAKVYSAKWSRKNEKVSTDRIGDVDPYNYEKIKYMSVSPYMASKVLLGEIIDLHLIYIHLTLKKKSSPLTTPELEENV